MSTNRQPAGTSIGGQWAPGAADEVDDSLTEGTDDWIAINEDEAHELEGDDVHNRVEVTRPDDDDNTPLPPAEVSELERKQFVADFKSAMIQDQSDRHHDDMLEQAAEDGEDGIVEEEITFDPDMERRVNAEAEAFLDKHSGDIDYLIKHPDTPISGWSDAGSDAYMAAAGHGVGYGDRVSTTSEASIVADRLGRSASEHFADRTRSGDGIDFEGSVSVEDGRILQ